MKPLPPCSREQIAHVLAVAAPTITKLEREGLPRCAGDDRRPQYDVRACVQWWIARQAQQSAKRAPGGLDERQMRARYYEQKANAAERENAVAAGTLVSPDVLEYALGQIAGRIAAALDALPSQIKTDIPHLRASEVRLIAERLARCRNGLARTQVDFTARH